MPISAQEAAEVARRHKLTLQDAWTLQQMADSVEEAKQLAADWTSSSSGKGDDELDIAAIVKDIPR